MKLSKIAESIEELARPTDVEIELDRELNTAKTRQGSRVREDETSYTLVRDEISF